MVDFYGWPVEDKMRKCTHILFLTVLGLSAVAHAETSVVPSLEWLADHCIDSGIYTVSAIEKKDGENSYGLSLMLKRNLRGNPIKQMVQDYCKIRLQDQKRDLVQKGDEFLICFQHHDTGEKGTLQTINMDYPQIAGFSYIAVSCELKLLKSKKDILKVFEGRLTSHPKGDPVEISDFSKDNRFELSSYPEIFSAIYGGSDCYIRVPKDFAKKVKTPPRQQELKANKTLQPAR